MRWICACACACSCACWGPLWGVSVQAVLLRQPSAPDNRISPSIGGQAAASRGAVARRCSQDTARRARQRNVQAGTRSSHLPSLLLPFPFCSQNYQAYQEALQGLDSIIGYAVKANNNFRIMQVRIHLSVCGPSVAGAACRYSALRMQLGLAATQARRPPPCTCFACCAYASWSLRQLGSGAVLFPCHTLGTAGLPF